MAVWVVGVEGAMLLPLMEEEASRGSSTHSLPRRAGSEIQQQRLLGGKHAT